MAWVCLLDGMHQDFLPTGLLSDAINLVTVLPSFLEHITSVTFFQTLTCNVDSIGFWSGSVSETDANIEVTGEVKKAVAAFM